MVHLCTDFLQEDLFLTFRSLGMPLTSRRQCGFLHSWILLCCFQLASLEALIKLPDSSNYNLYFQPSPPCPLTTSLSSKSLGSITSHGSLFQFIITPSEKKLPNIQREPPPVEPEAATFLSIAHYLGAEANPSYYACIASNTCNHTLSFLLSLSHKIYGFRSCSNYKYDFCTQTLNIQTLQTYTTALLARDLIS